jgi:hypothetical protein
VDEEYSFSVKMPAGWVQREISEGETTHLVASRDGPGLQAIHFWRRDNEKAFPAIEKAASPDMLPEELSEAFVASMRAEFNREGMEVIESQPATLGGAPGFRLLLEYRAGGGLRYRMLVYAASTPQGYYALIYDAALLHYFDRDLGAFQEILETLRISRATSLEVRES